MKPTTEQVWEVIPYDARRALVPAEADDLDEAVTEQVQVREAMPDLDVWDANRIVKTQWILIPAPIRRVIHSNTHCIEIGTMS